MAVKEGRQRGVDGRIFQDVKDVLNPARIRSFEEARGMRTFVGNQTSMSHMRTALVSHIQTL